MEWMMSCKKAATLMVAREDRPLAWGEGLGLRWHLAMCKACPRFEAQMLTMRSALSGWRHYREADDPTEPRR